VKVCQDAVRKARQEKIGVVILDTAGRLAIDRELMDELKRVESQVRPDKVFLVVDGMTGQDAVNSASAFNDALELDGVIMTKLDGDTRGGALLSVKQVTGVPIKFIGTGEHLDALEPFRPEGMAGRILGMGDILGLVDVARRAIDEKKRVEFEERLRAGQFTLEDFRNQITQFMKPGLMMKIMGMMPGMGELQKMMGDVDTERDTKRLVGIIDSMTPAERQNRSRGGCRTGGSHAVDQAVRGHGAVGARHGRRWNDGTVAKSSGIAGRRSVQSGRANVPGKKRHGKTALQQGEGRPAKAAGEGIAAAKTR
jgi:signal recognition particle subunit SRP54